MILNEEIRKKHSRMEDEKAISYSLLAKSEEYRKAYLKYVPVISSYCKFISKTQLHVLNLGFGAGILENIVLAEFNDIIFYSLDNSSTFNEICNEQNIDYIQSKRLKLYNLDIQKDLLPKRKFDIILSRDLNHHINTPKEYILRCIEALKGNGIFIMEDLRYDAEFSAIHDFSELVFNIPAFQTDRWNFYYKMLGLYESFASSYTKSEIEVILNDIKLIYFSNLVSGNRYHFVIYKNVKMMNLVRTFLKKLQ